jgi:hypothetical protein
LQAGRKRVEAHIAHVVHAPRGLEHRAVVIDTALQRLRALTEFLHQRPVPPFEFTRDRGRQRREFGALLLEALQFLERERRRQKRPCTVQIHVSIDGVDASDVDERRND